MHYSVFASLKNLLGCVVEHCEITNKHQSLMQQFFVVFILVIVFMSVNEQVIYKVEKLILQDLVLLD